MSCVARRAAIALVLCAATLYVASGQALDHPLSVDTPLGHITITSDDASAPPKPPRPDLNRAAETLPRLVSPQYDPTGSWAAVQATLEAFMPICNEWNHHMWRAFFHDCGTWNVYNQTGGCDGSLRFELNRPENVWAVPVTELYTQVVSLATARYGNIPGWTPPTFADLYVFGGLLSCGRCGGPKIPLVPGRPDAAGPNGEGLLPSPEDTLQLLDAARIRIGMTKRDFAAIIQGGHTIGDHTDNMDDSPHRIDNLYHQQILCFGKGSQCTPTQAPLTLPADLALLEDAEILTYTRAYAAGKTGNNLFLRLLEPATRSLMAMTVQTGVKPPKISAYDRNQIIGEGLNKEYRKRAWSKQLAKEQSRRN